MTAARRGSADASKIAAHVLKNGGTTAKCYEPWKKQDASVVEAVQKGPSAGLEDVAHDALSLAARIRDGLGLVANDARNGSRLATEIVNDLSSVGGDLRAARDAFRDYLNEAEAGDQAPPPSDGRPSSKCFSRSTRSSSRSSRRKRPRGPRSPAGIVASDAVASSGGFRDGYWTVRWASGATEPITLRDGCFSVYGEDYEIEVAGGRYFFEWGDGTVQTLLAFDGRTITWSTTNPDYPRIWWDRREPDVDGVGPGGASEDRNRPRPCVWGQAASRRCRARKRIAAYARRTRHTYGLADGAHAALALATQSNLDFDAVRAAQNAIRAPTELRFGSPPPPPPRAGDDATAQMARRFDRAEEARARELWAEASRRSTSSSVRRKRLTGDS